MDKYQASHFPNDDDLPPPYSPSAPDAKDGRSAAPAPAYDSKGGPAHEPGSDVQILTEMLDSVRSLLSSAEKMSPPPLLLESTFVPAAALGPGWSPSDPGEASRREVKRLFRICEPYGGDKKGRARDEGSSSGYTPYSFRSQGKGTGFADWGRFDDDAGQGEGAGASTLWWSDEDMAERLANELQPPVARPARPGPSKPSSQSQGIVRAFLLSFTDPSRVWPPRHPPSAGKSTSKAVPIDEGIPVMTARAEETTFRRENEMGLWESRTGWAVVVRIRSRF